MKNFVPHSIPFLTKVNRRDAPDYYDGTQARASRTTKRIMIFPFLVAQ